MLSILRKPVQEFPISSDTKRISMVCHDESENMLEVFTKGSEVDLSICDAEMDRTGNVRSIVGDEGFLELVEVQQEEMAKQGLLFLMLAYRLVSETC